MSRYRVECAATLSGSVVYALMDYCVDMGQRPKRVETFINGLCACMEAQRLNRADGMAKLAHDVRAQDARQRARDEQPPGCKSSNCEPPWCRNCGDADNVDMRAAFPASHFLMAGRITHQIRGSHEGIAHLRSMMKRRWDKVVELTRVNRTLRDNLRSAQQAADGAGAKVRQALQSVEFWKTAATDENERFMKANAEVKGYERTLAHANELLREARATKVVTPLHEGLTAEQWAAKYKAIERDVIAFASNYS